MKRFPAISVSSEGVSMYVERCLNDTDMAARIVKGKIQSMLHYLQRLPSVLDVHAPPVELCDVGVGFILYSLCISVLMVRGSVIVDVMLNDWHQLDP